LNSFFVKGGLEMNYWGIFFLVFSILSPIVGLMLLKEDFSNEKNE